MKVLSGRKDLFLLTQTTTPNKNVHSTYNFIRRLPAECSLDANIFATDAFRESMMIVEGIVTSVDAAGHLNIAPMGPIVAGDFASLLLRPFQPSTTFNNLAATRCGVFHVVDRVEVIAQAAIGKMAELPPVEVAVVIDGFVLKDCCRWFEFTVDSIDASNARSRMPSSIVYQGERRPFFGLNRARHAVLEAAILSTRLHLLSRQHVVDMISFLEPAVEKTGGTEEKSAFAMLKDFIFSQPETTSPSDTT